MLAQKLQQLLPWALRARNSWQTAAVSTSAALLKPEKPEPVPISKLYDNFLDGTSSTYLEELERKYQSDPSSVDKSWASFFSMAGAPSQVLGLHYFQRPMTYDYDLMYTGCRSRDPA